MSQIGAAAIHETLMSACRLIVGILPLNFDVLETGITESALHLIQVARYVGQGAANQIQIVGEVVGPQSLSYRDGLRILDVVVTVGGLTEFAAGNRANLVRQTNTGSVECRVKLKNLLAGDMSQNIDVYPGDVIIVPETRF